jgi:hypothetical protein
VLSGREIDREPPVAPGPAAEVVEELGLPPGCAAVEREVDPCHVPLAARERVAAHLEGACRDRVAVGRRQNVGVERDQAEWHSRARAGRPVLGQQPVGDVLEVALPRLRAKLDPLEPLDAAGADVAGHDHAHRPAMHRRERLAVHRPREHDLRAQRLVERDRAAEALGRLRLRAHVGAVEADMRRLAQRAGKREHVGERDTAPNRGARGAGSPRRLARDVADGDQPGAPVAGALQRRGHLALLGRFAQGVKRELQLPLDEAVHPQPPRGGVELRHRAVRPHVERIHGRHGTLGQGGEPGLGVERLLLVDDQVRALAVATHATSVISCSARSPSPSGSPEETRS